MYKLVIPKTKRFFLEFLKYWPSSHGLNKLVIKAKMHSNTYIVLKFSLLCENMMLQDLYIYIGETRPYFKTKHFLNMYFLYVLTQIGYFNTGFVKNTTKY